MADEFFTQNPQSPAAAPPAAVTPRGGSAKTVLAAVLVAFCLGAGGAGYAAWQGLIPFHAAKGRQAAAPAAVSQSVPDAQADDVVLRAAADTLAGRIAALEQRLNTLDQRADAASGNAGRSEALLIAFAARRALDRGVPLGFLEDQLRLRFANAQPNAVATVIEASRQPVTLDQLVAGLASLGSTLTDTPKDEDAWSTIKRQVSSLFVIRHETTPSPAPKAILEQAQILLEAGRIDDAITQVSRLPGSAAAADWFVAARRYAGSQRALDVLETTALFDPRSLKDAQGSTISTPSPVTGTPQTAEPNAGAPGADTPVVPGNSRAPDRQPAI